MSLPAVALNAAAGAVAALVTKTSLHATDPGTTGTAEVTGGTYARITPAFGTASGGVADLSASLTFNVPSGQTVGYYGHWAGSTFLGGKAVSGGATYASDGTYVLTSAPVDVT